jgi:Spy/CpxP family protein refolding chaperone
MIRNLRTIWLAAFAVTVVLAVSQVADAQRGEGGGGPRGPGGFGGPGGPRMMRGGSGAGFGAGSAVRLAATPEVQKALKLSKDQKKKVEEINDELRDGFRKLLQEGGAREGMQKVNEDAAAKLAEVLDDDQQKRLRGIVIQMLGAGAVMVDAELAKELEITPDQKTKLEEIQRSHMRKMSEAFRAGGVPDEDSRGKFEELRASGQKKLLDVLSSEQQEQLNSLKGEKVKIDIMKLRGGGSGNRTRGGGGFGGRGDRERGDRERGDRDGNDSADDSASKDN